MSTTFSSLPIVDLSPLRNPSRLSESDRLDLSKQLYNVFTTTGFAYLVNTPLSFKHADVFGLALEFFNLPLEEKMRLAKASFQPDNTNTYRGYFPVQPNETSDNLKEGFEMGPVAAIQASDSSKSSRFDLTEANVWPGESTYPSRRRLEELYAELQRLSSDILSLVALSLDKPSDFFAPYLTDSLSTLRLLHYPPSTSPSTLPVETGTPPPEPSDPVKLSCTPHTDSGILTLLHQDSTGGLEVQDASGKWVPAPYVPESLVVNIGDLMARVSGGRFVATMHRVRAPLITRRQHEGKGVFDEEEAEKFGRFSVPFFFEPGEKCLVKSVDAGNDANEGIVYGDHVRAKMDTFVEYRTTSL
jgi:isopenicillin N synthase-like dioxygenase